jgi:hypothetical protein
MSNYFSFGVNPSMNKTDPDIVTPGKETKLIIGIVGGVLAFFALTALLACICCKKKRRDAQDKKTNAAAFTDLEIKPVAPAVQQPNFTYQSPAQTNAQTLVSAQEEEVTAALMPAKNGQEDYAIGTPVYDY